VAKGFACVLLSTLGSLLLISSLVVQVFESIANFGSKTSIVAAKETALGHIENDFKVYTALNEGRNPLAGLETYVP
jgi:hypothetical protein